MILIVLKVKIRPEKRDEWLAGIKQYTADVRQEPGNVSFDYYENSENTNEFAIIETFADSDAGSAHVATEHAQNFFPFMARVISEKPKINYQDSGGRGLVGDGRGQPRVGAAQSKQHNPQSCHACGDAMKHQVTMSLTSFDTVHGIGILRFPHDFDQGHQERVDHHSPGPCGAPSDATSYWPRPSKPRPAMN